MTDHAADAMPNQIMELGYNMSMYDCTCETRPEICPEHPARRSPAPDFAAKLDALTTACHTCARSGLWDDGRAYAAARADVERYVEGLERQIASLRAFKRSVDESLNSGDGSYRP